MKLNDILTKLPISIEYPKDTGYTMDLHFLRDYQGKWHCYYGSVGRRHPHYNCTGFKTLKESAIIILQKMRLNNPELLKN